MTTMTDDPNFWACIDALEPDLHPTVATLIEAAFDPRPEALHDALNSGRANARGERPETAAPPTAYLSRISVRGFRGIGPDAVLNLTPGPGLTIVSGRNGCGKSSFAEALELVLTGENSRWSDAVRGAQLRAGWRNLHTNDSTRIEVQFSGIRGRTKLEMQWPKGSEDLAEGTLHATVDGQRLIRRELPWSAALEVYRPVLSYAGLGNLTNRSDAHLYDELAPLLGLDTLGVALGRLKALEKEVEASKKAARSQWKSIRTELADVDHPNAQTVLDAVGPRKWDLDVVERACADADTSDVGETLAALDQLRVLDVDAIARLTTGLEGSLAEHRRASESAAGQSAALATLLDAAIRCYTPDAPCPVCNGSALDEQWLDNARAQRDEATARAGALATLNREIQSGIRKLHAQLQSPPTALNACESLGLPTELLSAWSTLCSQTAQLEPFALVDHVIGILPEYRSAIPPFQEAVSAARVERNALWRPHAERLRAWLKVARSAQRAADDIRHTRAARKWLLERERELMAERFIPIESKVKRFWEALRQRSHVSIETVSLEGAHSSTRRGVRLDVCVDGKENVALGVMSQGELHSLALSLFLPRLTHEDSPFHFVVLDDPVQAMDPAKVDGLARVLEEVSQQRQVVVFTHDARLPESIRRLRIEADLLRVERANQSVVKVVREMDPVQQYLSEATAVSCQSDMLGPKATRRVVPVFCRAALEACFRRAYRRRALDSGVPYALVDAKWREAHTTVNQAALGIFGDIGRSDKVFTWLRRRAGDRAVSVLKACKAGAHTGWDTLHSSRIDDTRELIRAIERALHD